LGIYHYNARFYSPKIGRFLSPDTIIPGYANPQNLNRFSYVLNNPLKYTDPTGHCISIDGERTCGSGKAPRYDPPKKDKKDKGEKDDNLASSIDNYCGGPVGLACASYMFQDAATLIDAVGVVFTEIPLVTAGCAAGPEGCLAGELAAWAAWNASPANATETMLSLISLGLTVTDDYFNNGGLGENTLTSSGTFLAGLVNTPSGDLIVDGYASGYNHGLFNGLTTIISGGPIIK
jgi:hypothetical protein